MTAHRVCELRLEPSPLFAIWPRLYRLYPRSCQHKPGLADPGARANEMFEFPAAP